MRRTITILHSEPTEKIIEKSRFITYSARVESEEEAKAFLAALKDEHPFATHICYAYIADRQGNLQRFSDNGEPQGTAGMPILENLRVRCLVNAAVAVVRYFGGIKLGAGGLTRAYAACAKEQLESAALCEILPCETWRVAVEYSAAEGVKKFLARRGYRAAFGGVRGKSGIHFAGARFRKRRTARGAERFFKRQGGNHSPRRLRRIFSAVIKLL